MLAKIFIKEIHVKLIAAVMGFISIVIFSIAPFLKEVETGSILREIDQICFVNQTERDWKYIVLHHSATKEGNAAQFDAFHKKKRKWKYGLAYHFVIGNGTYSGDGEIEVGSRWKKQLHGAHTGKMSLNKIAIGICLVGNFETQDSPTKRQLRSLLYLVRYLCKKHDISVDNVVGHYNIQKNHTSCPGKYFPIDEFKITLAQRLIDRA